MRGRTLLPKLVLVLTLAAPIAARAQSGTSADDTTETRTLALAAQREAKSASITTPERSGLEQKLYWYDNQHLLDKVFAGWHGVHLGGASFPAGAGTKFAIGYDSPGQNWVDVSARAARSTRGYTRLAGNVDLHPLPAPIALSIGADRYEYPQEDFFGLGSSSLESNRTDYRLKSTDVGADLRFTPHKTLLFNAGVWRLRPETGVGTDPRFSSSGDVFDPASLPGYGVQSEFMRAEAGAAIDLRDNPMHPKSGGRYGVTVASYQPRDSSAFDFRRVEIDLQQYVPLPNRYRTLALRASAVFTDTNANNEVPFYYLPTLGGAQALRGFREFRFRDRDSMIVSAEYRWEAWWALDGAFFVDVGEVAPSRGAFTFDNVEASYGVGFRLHSNKAFISRLDLAFSREGFIPLLRFEHAF